MSANTDTARLVRRIANLVMAVVVGIGLMIGSALGAGSTPALGALLNPGTGVWTSAGGATVPTDATYTIPGIRTHTTVGFEKNGTAHITAGSDADMFRAIGFAHGRFRIFQMDLLRRQAQGRLAQVLGRQAVDSDRYELDVGLLRAARRDWNALPKSAPARAALIEYSAGVNAAIAQMRANDSLPMFFKLLGYTPKRWTPVDSLLVQRLMTQTLSLDMKQLSFTYLAKAMGKATFDHWFPLVPRNKQHPYDPGPYAKLPLRPLPSSDPAAPHPKGNPAPHPKGGPTAQPSSWSKPAAGAATTLASALLHRASTLPRNAIHHFGNSNAWAVAGSKTASGQAILASDPHLRFTLPSAWFQLSAHSPSYDMTGVTLPGVPVVLLGKNKSISWGIANSQHPTTFFYLEKTDPAHPDQYYWDGAWRPMEKIDYTIPVKGQASVHHLVRITNNGPIVTHHGVTASMWWAGTLPSDNLDSALKLVRAKNFAQFHEALRGWRTPAENFAYADKAGNIGIVNAGYAPQFPSCSPYLPMSGTGECDVVGTIPFDALPITHNPPSGFAAVSNQREVSGAYPYYFGRGFDFFAQGWRQAEIVPFLKDGKNLTLADMKKLQLSDVEPVARAYLPVVLPALEAGHFTGRKAEALRLLKNWHYSLSKDSAAARIWVRFFRIYEYDVWHPFWQKYHIPDVPKDTMTPSKSAGGDSTETLRGTLLQLSKNDPGNPVFHPAGAPASRTAPDVMRSAFAKAIDDLTDKYGPYPAKWQYGKHHYVLFESLLRNPTLDDGPYHFGSNGHAVNSILGHPAPRHGKKLKGVNNGGASWRFLIDWGTGKALYDYPGGASENPASPWYDNGVAGWMAGRYLPMREGPKAIKATKGRTWTLVS